MRTDKLLGRDDILDAVDVKIERVETPEWGGHVYVRGLSGEERDGWEASLVQMQRRGRKRAESQVNTRNIRAKLCVVAICDADGNQLFEEADVERLGKKSAAALDRCFAAAQRLSGLSDDDVEDIAKNSDSTPADASIAA